MVFSLYPLYALKYSIMFFGVRLEKSGKSEDKIKYCAIAHVPCWMSIPRLWHYKRPHENVGKGFILSYKIFPCQLLTHIAEFVVSDLFAKELNINLTLHDVVLWS